MQTQTKFTPGPWKAMSAHKAHNVVDYVSAESGLHICDVASYGASPEQRQANAKLISLAPEMLDALQRIADICAGDLRESLHGEAQTKFDFEAQLRTVRGHTIGLSAIANSILSKLNS